MNKVEFIERISERTGFSDEKTRCFLDAFQDEIKDALRDGDFVRLPGFCTFDTYMKKAHYGKNELYYSDYIYLPETKIVRIRAGSALKQAAKETDKVPQQKA